MSMFTCFPRQLSSRFVFPVTILERHPYTTQTFTPLGLSPSDGADAGAVYLVIVAPSLPSPSLSATQSQSQSGNVGVSASISNPPDLSKLAAFVAHGGQAVTYAAGTWHAPMAVLGRRRVDFVVTQFVNGVPADDTQEVRIGPGVEVRLEGLWDGGSKTKL